MTVHKFITILLFFMCCVCFSQEKPPYPKDTIYVKYQKDKDKKIIDWNYKNDNGIYFSIKESKNKSISIFTSYKSKFDTLSIKKLKDIKFSNLNEINIKWNEWFKKNKRPPINRNGVFVTYVIEQINEDCIVKYPVIWRNEGVKD